MNTNTPAPTSGFIGTYTTYAKASEAALRWQDMEQRECVVVKSSDGQRWIVKFAAN